MNPPPTSNRRGLVAYIAPFALYLGITMLESKGWLGIAHEYEILCTAKGIVVALLLWCFRGEYPAWSSRGLGLAVMAGIVGFVVWIGLDWLQTALPGFQAVIDSVMQGGRAGYDPFADPESRMLRLTFVGVRIAEMAAIVPVMEELFWRGFLARYLLADDFRKAPQGVFTPFSFAVVTLAFASVHPEVLAAIGWGALINLIFRRTANLWACVVMHATTNAVLAAYILATGHWRLW
ncbi:MAG: CAAX prenyl protease-related protein [Planctomycetes bacterium]|nr:CAAX prenyl protease-related protein [Planctomycetota bacterium]